MNDEQLEKMKLGQGFIAALDQSGGSAPKALKLYGIDEDRYSDDDEMFALMHAMRSRIIESPSFDGDDIIGAILFEDTMDREIGGRDSVSYLWDEKRVVPFLKVDKGLVDEQNGVQIMRPIPGLGSLLSRARDQGVFGTKMRSFIQRANHVGIKAVVDQQFEVAKKIMATDLVPIIETEVDIHSPEKGEAEMLLRANIAEQLTQLKSREYVMVKLSLPDVDDFYADLVDHPNVLRVLALSGGYSREEADARLAANHGVIASFSRSDRGVVRTPEQGRIRCHSTLRIMPEGPRRAADSLVQCLEHEGVTCVFGIPGEENIYLTDALSRSSIRYLLVRHEQAASFMAEIHGRLTGRAGVCSATLGPGAINLLLGTADAYTNSTPALAISAQVGLNRIYKESHQSVDLVCHVLAGDEVGGSDPDPGAIPEMVRKAFKLAQTERPGPVYLGVPEDVEAAFVPDQLVPLHVNTPRTDEPSPSQFRGRPPCSTREPATHHPGRARSRRIGSGRRTAALLRTSEPPGGHHVPRKGRVPRRSSALSRCRRVHESRLCQLRVRRRGRDRQRRVRTTGVRPGPDQPRRGQADHPFEPSPCRSGRPLRRRSGNPGRHREHAGRPG